MWPRRIIRRSKLTCRYVAMQPTSGNFVKHKLVYKRWAHCQTLTVACIGHRQEKLQCHTAREYGRVKRMNEPTGRSTLWPDATGPTRTSRTHVQQMQRHRYVEKHVLVHVFQWEMPKFRHRFDMREAERLRRQEDIVTRQSQHSPLVHALWYLSIEFKDYGFDSFW